MQGRRHATRLLAARSSVMARRRKSITTSRPLHHTDRRRRASRLADGRPRRSPGTTDPGSGREAPTTSIATSTATDGREHPILRPGSGMRPDPGRPAGSGEALATTTEQKAFVAVSYPTQASCPLSRDCDRIFIFGLIRMPSSTFIGMNRLAAGRVGYCSSGAGGEAGGAGGGVPSRRSRITPLSRVMSPCLLPVVDPGDRRGAPLGRGDPR
jgi:hypothetical protein